MSFTCDTCGKSHDGMPMDIAFANPLSYFMIPEAERADRVEATDDHQVIDKSTFIVRGILCLRVIDHDDEFCFGVWATVNEQAFSAITGRDEGDASALAFDGTLDGDIRVFPDTLDSAVKVHVQPDGMRPRFVVKDMSTPLGAVQKNGISIARVHEIQHEYLGGKD